MLPSKYFIDQITMETGVITGIITFFIIELIKWAYFKRFEPWLESANFKGSIILTDVWKEHYEESLETKNPERQIQPDRQVQDIVLELNQKGNCITGICILTDKKTSDRPLGIRKLSINGTTKNRYVALTLELDNKKRFGMVTYLLEVTSAGNEMKGYASYYDAHEGVLRTSWTTLRRENS